jgi:hypothetical protein
MDAERVCGTCVFGADANDRFGNIDPNYVICQIKASEIQERKPNRFHTTSAVTRMHYNREACLHWRADMAKIPGEQALPMQEHLTPPEPVLRHDYQAPHLDQPAASLSEEQKALQLKVIQQDQMVLSLQNQVGFLSEQVQDLQTELAEKTAKLERLSPFDPAIFAEVNYFALLGIQENASAAEIKDAYRKRMKHLHPDRFINISQRLNIAYETLTDPERRRQYLQQIRAH